MGRALVSKTSSSRFESCHPCQIICVLCVGGEQFEVRWRDWPNGLGAGLWIQSREFDSLISPQMGGSYKGIIRGLQPRDASSTLAPSTKVEPFCGREAEP